MVLQIQGIYEWMFHRIIYIMMINIDVPSFKYSIIMWSPFLWFFEKIEVQNWDQAIWHYRDQGMYNLHECRFTTGVVIPYHWFSSIGFMLSAILKNHKII